MLAPQRPFSENRWPSWPTFVLVASFVDDLDRQLATAAVWSGIFLFMATLTTGAR